VAPLARATPDSGVTKERERERERERQQLTHPLIGNAIQTSSNDATQPQVRVGCAITTLEFDITTVDCFCTAIPVADAHGHLFV
jgi:hypothetical protein